MEPLGLYCPMGHGVPIAEEDPVVHTCPADALQVPEQSDVVRPVALPNRPAGQGEQTPALPLLYWPTGHGSPEDVVAPSPQYLPGVVMHIPAHTGDVAPAIQTKAAITHCTSTTIAFTRHSFTSNTTSLTTTSSPALRQGHDQRTSSTAIHTGRARRTCGPCEAVLPCRTQRGAGGGSAAAVRARGTHVAW